MISGLLLSIMTVLVITLLVFVILYSNQVFCSDDVTSSVPEQLSAEMKGDGRLPRHIQPVLYRVELFPYIYGDDPSQFYVEGTTWIHVHCLEDAMTITLNINKLQIKHVKVKLINQAETTTINDTIDSEIVNYDIDTYWQMMHIHHNVTAGEDYAIAINYKAPLKMDSAGMYLSMFRNKKRNKYVAATQFSPTDARKAFPCFDEPDRKSKFEIILVRHKELVSLSNMPKLRIEHREGDFVADVFERTPRMSTYLLAMVVGDFQSISEEVRPGLTYTTWASEANINKTKVGLDIGIKVLQGFENYFGIDFPLPKQDILAVPQTAVSAMENWGLIIFRESSILYEEDEYSEWSLFGNALTISHEITHQWFGNLVTMDWWSRLMLKEGFAVYFEFVGTNMVYPEWSVLELFVNYMHNVLKADSLESTRALEIELADATEIRQVFNIIPYWKGGSIIRMLDFILGPDNFQAGLGKYLSIYKYDNANFTDFCKAVQPDDWSDESILDIINTWIHQKNYPLVTVKQLNPGELLISQERFCLNSNETEEKHTKNYIWTIPFTFTTNLHKNFDLGKEYIHWLNESKAVLYNDTLPDLTVDGNWLIGNVQQYGYYRVNYDVPIWLNIIKQLKQDHTQIHPVNRAQIINDLFSLSSADIVELKFALQAFEYLDKEDHYVPWVAALNEVDFMDKLLKYSPLYSNYVHVWKRLLEKPLLSLEQSKQNNTLPFQEALLYSKLFNTGAAYGVQRCIDKAKTDFVALRKNSSVSLNAGTRQASLCTALKTSNMTDWSFVLQLYKSTVDVEKKNSYLFALSCTNDPSLQNRLITISQDVNTMNGQDVIFTLGNLAKNPSGLDKVWRHMTTEWDYFVDRFGGSLFELASLVKQVTEYFTSQEQLEKLTSFVETTSNLGPAEQTFNQAIERTYDNIAWVTKHKGTLEQWAHELLKI